MSLSPMNLSELDSTCTNANFTKGDNYISGRFFRAVLYILVITPFPSLLTKIEKQGRITTFFVAIIYIYKYI